MPELPEIKKIVEALNEILVGNNFVSLTVHNTSKFYATEFRGNTLLEKSCFDGNFIYNGKGKFVDIFSHGKKIFFEVEIGSNESLFFYSFLGLSGLWVKSNVDMQLQWKIKLCYSKNSRFGNPPLKLNLFFYDNINFGNFEVFNDINNLKIIIKDCGPEYFSEGMTEEMFINRLLQSNIQNMEIGTFLMEQKYFSGIGAYLNSDILFTAKISPFREIKNINIAEKKLLYESILAVIKFAYDCGGRNSSEYVNPFGIKGNYETLVYDKQIDIFGNLVTKSKMKNKRTVYWVENIQT